KRAARETTDLLALYELLGRQVNNPRDRAEFLARGRQRAAAGLGQERLLSAKPERAAGRAADRAAQSPNPASIVAIQSDLTRYIGPIAKILVKRELEKFETLAKLCLVLAAHIPNANDRRAFLDAHGAE